ncbi:MAG: hypothetical protein GX193_11085 [Clostridiales bacterium]|nr:hypothetical protein [Clostridiales bacterium]
MHTKYINSRKKSNRVNVVQTALFLLGLICILYSTVASDTEVFDISQLSAGLLAGIAILLTGTGYKKLKTLSRVLLRRTSNEAGRIAASLFSSINCFRMLMTGNLKADKDCKEISRTLVRQPDFVISIERLPVAEGLVVGPRAVPVKKCS